MTIFICSVEDANATDTNLTKTISTTSKTVTAATKANPCQVTMTGHTMVNGDKVSFASVGGMTQLNGNTYTVTYVDANNITIGVDSTAYGTYTTGGTGTILGATQTNPLRIHAIGHSMVAGQRFYVSAVSGMTQLNSLWWTVSSVLSVDSFEVNVNANGYTAYTSGGSMAMQQKTITGATQANPCVITSPGHGRANGQRIMIENVVGMTELNGKTFTVANVTTDTLELSGTDSTAFTAYSSAGDLTWMRATIQSAYNQCANGDSVYVEKTTAASSILGATNFTWNRNTQTVNITGTTPVGTISVGDYIGPSTAAGNGHTTTYYKVTAVSASSITLEYRFWHSDSVSALTEAGCKRVVPVAEGSSGASILTTTSTTVNVTGGYTFTNNTAPARDGETWLKHAFTEGTSANQGFVIAGGTVSYFNIVDCYYCFNIGSTTAVASYFTGLSSAVYAMLVSSTPTISNIMMNCPVTYATILVQGNATFGASCYAFGSTSAGVAQVSSSGVVVNGVYSRATAGYALGSSSVGAGFTNCDARYASDGFRLTHAGCFVRDSVASMCSYGITSGTLVAGSYVDGCTLTSNSYGIQVTQSSDFKIYDTDFITNTYDVYIDGYSSNVYMYSCTSTTPTTQSLFRAANSSGITTCVNCTIDDASRYKLLSLSSSTGNQNVVPQFRLHNSFGITGELYPYKQITRNYGASPYTIANLASTGNNSYPTILLRVAAQTGVGLEISYDLCVPSSQTFTQTPVVLLNGIQIQSETAITSFTTYPTWTSYIVTIAGGSITTDGVIELAFIQTVNSGIMYFKCTGVTE